MIVISSTELRSDINKYLDMAKTEKVVIQRGGTEAFVLTRESSVPSENGLAEGLTAEELLIGIEEDIRQAYRKKYQNE